MKKILFISALALVACGNKTGSNSWTLADSTQTVASQGKHSAEYIIQRLDSIYSSRIDSLCCSQHYLAVYAQAHELSLRDGTVILEANHWTQSQDMPEDWSYTVESIDQITDSSAQATVTIHNFDDQKVTLDLVYEHDNWYVDNFRSLYEGADYDADGNKIPGTDGVKEFNELKSIMEYIQKPGETLDSEPTPEPILRRSSLEEAEEMSEAAKRRQAEEDDDDGF